MTELDIAQFIATVLGIIGAVSAATWWIIKAITSVLKAVQEVHTRLDDLNGSVAEGTKELRAHADEDTQRFTAFEKELYTQKGRLDERMGGTGDYPRR